VSTQFYHISSFYFIIEKVESVFSYRLYSVQHTAFFVIRIENPTRCHSVSKFYFIFIWSSTCFGRHTANHQEPKTALTTSCFAYVEGCWTCSCWPLSDSGLQLHAQQPFTYAKPEAASAVLGSW